MDWKIVCIDVEDPWAERLHSVDDLKTLRPGVIPMLREVRALYSWLCVDNFTVSLVV